MIPSSAANDTHQKTHDPILAETEALCKIERESEYKALLTEAESSSWQVFDREGLLLELKDCRDYIKVLEAVEVSYHDGCFFW